MITAMTYTMVSGFNDYGFQIQSGRHCSKACVKLILAVIVAVLLTWLAFQ